MIKFFKNLFKKREVDLSQYSGMADFFLRAPDDLKKKVMTEAAIRSNTDQMAIFQKSNIRISETR